MMNPMVEEGRDKAILFFYSIALSASLQWASSLPKDFKRAKGKVFNVREEMERKGGIEEGTRGSKGE